MISSSQQKMRQWLSGLSCPFERSTWSPLAFPLFTSSPSLFSVAMRHSSWSQGFHNSLLEEQKPKRWTKQGRPTQTSSHLTHTSHLWLLRWHTNSQFKTSTSKGLGKILILYSTKSTGWIFGKFCAKPLKATRHLQCTIAYLLPPIGSDLPNHETTLFSPANKISIYGCSRAEKGRGRPMRNGPSSPCIMHTRQSLSGKRQQTGNQSL